MCPVPLQSLRRLARGLVIALGVASTAPALAYSVVRPALGYRKGWIELLDDFAPWLYLAAPFALIVGQLVGSRAAMAAGGAASAMFVRRWGGRFVRWDGCHTRDATSTTAGALTLMTFNVLAWTRDGDDIAAAIARIDPDVVTLQEIGPRPMARLLIALGDRLPYSAVHATPSSAGTATLSRFPLSDAEPFTLSALGGHWCARMTVHAPTGPIALFNIHTKIPRLRMSRRHLGRYWLPAAFHAERRLVEVHKLCAMIDAIEGPLLLMGDFNMTERSEDYALIARRLTDAYREVGRGLGQTFPAWRSVPQSLPLPFPMLRLDHIWYSRHFAAVWAKVGPSAGSDHHSVVVRVATRTRNTDP